MTSLSGTDSCRRPIEMSPFSPFEMSLSPIPCPRVTSLIGKVQRHFYRGLTPVRKKSPVARDGARGTNLKLEHWSLSAMSDLGRTSMFKRLVLAGALACSFAGAAIATPIPVASNALIRETPVIQAKVDAGTLRLATFADLI